MSPRSVARKTFRSLSVRNYRLYFAGQIVSMTGTWMQWVAQGWLVLRMTGSGFAVGAVTATQFLPMLFGGAYGGVIADRVDKRKLLVGTQSSAGLLALILGILVTTGTVRLWMVFAIALTLGFVNAIDNPARQSFVSEMVHRDQVTNAVSLNSVLANGTRVVGPTIAAFLIAGVGIGLCFLINAASYAAVVIGLLLMRTDELYENNRAKRQPGQIREGIRYVRRRSELWLPLLLMVVVGAFAYNFSVLLPLLSRFTFNRGPVGYGEMFSVLSVGAVISGLTVAAMGRATQKIAALAALSLGITTLLAAVMPNFGAELVALVAVGAASTVFMAVTNSVLQLRASPAFRGRVMALFAMAFLGTTPLGAPLVGWIGEQFGPRAGFAFGAFATIVAASVALVLLPRLRRREPQPAEPARPLIPPVAVAETPASA